LRRRRLRRRVAVTAAIVARLYNKFFFLSNVPLCREATKADHESAAA
jgi:hypothetical protein